jgi:4-oxalocrotonate tautomerase
MPMTHISLRKGKSPDYHRALVTQIYLAMRETFNVPEEDRFMTISEHRDDQFDFGPDYLGVTRSGDLLMIQITANNTRTLAQKKALYSRIAERLAADPGVRPEDVLISLVEVEKENWSFGNGEAQYAPAG